MNKPDIHIQAAGQSTEALLAWLQESPKTQGWDAIVAYNRGCANALLRQQYLARLTSENYLTPIDGAIGGENGSTEHLFGVRLGLPRLSFENANIDRSKVRLTIPVASGLSITKGTPAGAISAVWSIKQPSAAAGPKLWMDLELKTLTGEVDNIGRVALDLTDMTTFTTDLLSDDLGKLNAEKFFKEKFLALPEDQRIYTLGMLNNVVDSALAPKNFRVQTQAAPGAMSRAAPNYGDGAVLLLVTLKGGSDGGIPTPNSDFRYLIPYEDGGDKYSGAVILSNKVLMSKILKPAIELALPGITYAVKTPTDDKGNPLHQYLQATAGHYLSGEFDYSAIVGYANGWFKSPSVVIAFVDSTSADNSQTIVAKNNTLYLSWHTTSENDFEYGAADHWVGNDCTPGFKENRRVTIALNADVPTTVSVDPQTSIVIFQQDADPDEQVTVDGIDGTFRNDEPYEGVNKLRAELVNIVANAFFDLLNVMKLPDIDTFTVSNLLFPNSRSMILQDAFVPGDLALFGNVDPSLTSFVISPEEPIMVVGSTQKFTTEPELTSKVIWSVKGLAGSTDAIGHVDPDGLYTAPAREDQKGSSTQVILTATSASDTGQTLSSSALVSIVKTRITLNPIFQVVTPSKSADFTAGSTSGAPLEWAMKDPGQGATLVPATGEAGGTPTPLAPPQGTALFTLDVVQVSDGSGTEGIAQADVLVINGVVSGEVKVVLDTAHHQATLSLIYPGDDGPVVAPSGSVTWTLLAGTGKVVNSLYTEPDVQDPGFALVTGVYSPVQGISFKGYTALPLPLSEYLDLGRVFS